MGWFSNSNSERTQIEERSLQELERIQKMDPKRSIKIAKDAADASKNDIINTYKPENKKAIDYYLESMTSLNDLRLNNKINSDTARKLISTVSDKINKIHETERIRRHGSGNHVSVKRKTSKRKSKTVKRKSKTVKRKIKSAKRKTSKRKIKSAKRKPAKSK